MSSSRSATTIVAAAVAATGLWWLVWNVNHHGDELQRGLAANLTQSEIVRVVVEPTPTPAALPPAEGLELIDMYECMCAGPIGTNISGWVGLWLMTVLVGGLPTAILLRLRAPVADRG